MLEFDKIREKLAAQAMTPLGKKLSLHLFPQDSYALISKLQQETTEATIRWEEKDPPFTAIKDLESIIAYAQRGGKLSAAQLWEIGRFLKAVAEIKPYLTGTTQKLPLLQEKAAQLVLLDALYKEIKLSIGESEQILDTASQAIASLRRRKMQVENKLRETLESFIRSAAIKKYLQDPIITTRNNRYVVPVKAEYKSFVKGIVHDRSSSGFTFFIEPAKTVELNNLIVSLQKETEQEIERILTVLSAKVGTAAEILSTNYQVYGELDAIFARGRMSREMAAIEPEFNENESETVIIAGRHPLIPAVSVVPIDINIGKNFRSLIITGPNTGGKTVTLKTVGLFSLMAQSGLHLPAKPGTKLAIYQKIFADIGDEQSIEQSLSTFSGHMENIATIISAVNDKSLVLLDELGAGTDPVEGSALAMSLLLYFYHQGAVTIATSHYSELKVFAHTHVGMQNASVEFDVETLQPTYRLLMNVPGKSNALAIAARLGLPAEIIDKARGLQRKDNLKVEDMVADLIEKQKQITVERDIAFQMRSDAQIYLERARAKTIEVESKREVILQKAREEALLIINRAKSQADEVYRALKKINKATDTKVSLGKVQVARETIKLEQQELYKNQNILPQGEKVKLSEIKPGMSVFVKNLNKEGQVLEVNSAGEVNLQVGIIKIKTTVDDLLLKKPEKIR